MAGLKLLTAAEHAVLVTPERVDFGPTHKRIDAERRWQEVPLVIEVDAAPLATLAEQAAVGYRLYEFMSLRRPGDLLRYMQVTLVDVPDALLQLSAKALVTGQSLYTPAPLKLGDRLGFDAFDHRLWTPESDWRDDDADEVCCLWIRHRETSDWVSRQERLLATVEALQARLRESRDELIRHEIALIDGKKHRRDYWARTQLHDGGDPTAPDLTAALPSGLVELLCSLARRSDIKSISASVKDYALWRGLVWEQIKRSAAEGVPPEDALALSGTDAGPGHVCAADWGGHLHIPYEGACEADVYVLPSWRGWHREAAEAAGSVVSGLLYMQHLPKVFITPRDFGPFEAEERTTCEGWVVYRKKA